MKLVEYHPFALDELIQAAEYYESKVDGLGQRFLDEIEFCVADISESPERWPYLLLNTRCRLLDRFPYLLVYLGGEGDVVKLSSNCQYKLGEVSRVRTPS
jgi:hypothetical protein